MLFPLPEDYWTITLENYLLMEAKTIYIHTARRPSDSETFSHPEHFFPFSTDNFKSSMFDKMISRQFWS